MRPRVAIIGGSGFSTVLKGDQKIFGTPYGPTPKLTFGEVKGKQLVFLPRHGEGHTVPPHKVNYRANLWGLRELGVERIIATNAVGAIDEELQPGSIVVPFDIIDLTKSRRNTFYEGAPVTHVDVSAPYCPTILKTLSDSAAGIGRKGKDGIVMACTEGPRYETPAEIRMLRTMGGGVVGMTAAPEVFLARELEMCYGSVCFVSNMAAGLQRTLSAQEVEERGRDSGQILNKIIVDAVENIPESRKGCSCGRALSSAQLGKEDMKELEGEDTAR